MQESTIRRKENQSISMEAGFQSRKTLKILTPETIYSSCNSPGQNTGVGSCSLLQRIFPTQGSNPGLLHCRLILHLLSLWGSPRILEWVAYPFSRGSFPPRNRTRIFCIAGGFLTSWATKEAPKSGKETKGEVVPCCFHGNKEFSLTIKPSKQRQTSCLMREWGKASVDRHPHLLSHSPQTLSSALSTFSENRLQRLRHIKVTLRQSDSSRNGSFEEPREENSCRNSRTCQAESGTAEQGSVFTT